MLTRIRTTNASSLVDGQIIVTFNERWRGASTDTYPVLAANRNGSTLWLMDTREMLMYDGDSLTWIPQFEV